MELSASNLLPMSGFLWHSDPIRLSNVSTNLTYASSSFGANCCTGVYTTYVLEIILPSLQGHKVSFSRSKPA